jgi:hypothetical protein
MSKRPARPATPGPVSQRSERWQERVMLGAALEAFILRTNVQPLPALRSWLDSWNGLGAVSVSARIAWATTCN